MGGREIEVEVRGVVIIGGGLGLSERKRGWMWDSTEEERVRQPDGGDVAAELTMFAVVVLGIDDGNVGPAAAAAAAAVATDICS